MKTKLQFFVSALLIVSSFHIAKAEHKPIIIVREPTTPSEVIHRAPAQIPITCILEDDSFLVLNYLENLGMVSVEIENQTTGEYDQLYVNALLGSMIFPISGTTGNWTITLTLSSGAVYKGDFIIY